MLRIFVVCSIRRQMIRKKLLSNMIHVNLSKPIVFANYELSGEIALKNNHYYYYYYMTRTLKFLWHRKTSIFYFSFWNIITVENVFFRVNITGGIL